MFGLPRADVFAVMSSAERDIPRAPGPLTELLYSAGGAWKMPSFVFTR